MESQTYKSDRPSTSQNCKNMIIQFGQRDKDVRKKPEVVHLSPSYTNVSQKIGIFEKRRRQIQRLFQIYVGACQE